MIDNNSVRINTKSLQINLKSTFRHAGSTRKFGESVWAMAERNGITGFGEGCPRVYSAGDDLESSVSWTEDLFTCGKTSFRSFEEVKDWGQQNSSLIDFYPSAWCAVEMALIDLFSKEQNICAETLLGIKNINRSGKYTAVLGDDKKWKFTTLTDQYLVKGFTDFKVKINESQEKNLQKLEILKDLSEQHGITDIRIRLDANNLWADRAAEAITHLDRFKNLVFAVEEPVGAGDVDGINAIIENTGLSVILDESLCFLDDISKYKKFPGKYIANIKISRVGGLLRALEMVDELKKQGWPIIVGCHVGETSLLSRAALIIGPTVDDNLIAREGAFGDHLVEWEPVKPGLKFGRAGFMNLNDTYYYKTVEGLNIVPVKNWNRGFGIDCRMPITQINGNCRIAVLKMDDLYDIHYRVWGPEEGDDVIFILHGGMSHSLWQTPLAEKIRDINPNLTVVASDRRGCGLNDKRGDLGSVKLVVNDVVAHINYLKKSFKRIHLAGWCQGCQFTSIAAEKVKDKISTLLMLTPGLFWNDRFRSVITVSENSLLSIVKKFKLKPDRDNAWVPIPMEPEDFTLDKTWLDFIESDRLKTTKITLKTMHIMDEIQELSWVSILACNHPMLAILATQDRIVDNYKVRQFLGDKFLEEDNENEIMEISSAHAIQFGNQEIVAQKIVSFIKKINSLHKVTQAG